MRPLEIMYVEDNPADILLLKSAFQIAEFEPHLQLAHDGDSALKLLEMRHAEDGYLPDVILLDLNLPRLNGFEVLKNLHAKSDFSNIPVVIFSGSANPDDRSRALDLKASDFWMKPENLSDAIAIAEQLKAYQVSGTLAVSPSGT